MTVLWRRERRRHRASRAALISAGEHLERTPDVEATPELRQELVERLRDPETVARGLVRGALFEMENHYWADRGDPIMCACGLGVDGTGDPWSVMRRHKEDVLANHLGLTIRPDVA